MSKTDVFVLYAIVAFFCVIVLAGGSMLGGCIVIFVFFRILSNVVVGLSFIKQNEDYSANTCFQDGNNTQIVETSKKKVF